MGHTTRRRVITVLFTPCLGITFQIIRIAFAFADLGIILGAFTAGIISITALPTIFGIDIGIALIF